MPTAAGCVQLSVSPRALCKPHAACSLQPARASWLLVHFPNSCRLSPKLEKERSQVYGNTICSHLPLCFPHPILLLWRITLALGEDPAVFCVVASANGSSNLSCDRVD